MVSDLLPSNHTRFRWNFIRVHIDFAGGPRSSREYFESHLERDQRCGKLGKNIDVAFHLRGTVLDLCSKTLLPHHNDGQVGSINRDRQIRIFMEKSLDICECRIR